MTCAWGGSANGLQQVVPLLACLQLTVLLVVPAASHRAQGVVLACHFTAYILTLHVGIVLLCESKLLNHLRQQTVCSRPASLADVAARSPQLTAQAPMHTCNCLWLSAVLCGQALKLEHRAPGAGALPAQPPPRAAPQWGAGAPSLGPARAASPSTLATGAGLTAPGCGSCTA